MVVARRRVNRFPNFVARSVQVFVQFAARFLSIRFCVVQGLAAILSHLLGCTPRLFARLLGLLARTILIRPGAGDGGDCENYHGSVSHPAWPCK
jgi:hypothetical protein